MDLIPPEYVGTGLSPAFELICIGSGGGPLENDLSAYLIKPLASRWSDGCISLEAGSGIGTLSDLLSRNPNLIPELGVPSSSAQARNLAALMFSYIGSYLITHAHLDHVASLIIGSGGLTPPSISPPAPPNSYPARIVYGSLDCLQNLETAFRNSIWPDIGGFAVPEGEGDAGGGKGCGADGKVLSFVPIPQPPKSFNAYTSLLSLRRPESFSPNSSLPPSTLSVLSLPISHGSCAAPPHPLPSLSPVASASSLPSISSSHPLSILPLTTDGNLFNGTENGKGKSKSREKKLCYETSAFFLRCDLPPSPSAESSVQEATGRREIVFFGDVEPDSLSLDPRNRAVWELVAEKFAAGVLDTVFIECSYLSSRPDSSLYGHLSPPHLIAELSTLASLVTSYLSQSSQSSRPSFSDPLPSSARPLSGLKVLIIHCKEIFDLPSPSSAMPTDERSIREKILEELVEAEGKALGGQGLGCEFVMVQKGMRLVV